MLVLIESFWKRLKPLAVYANSVRWIAPTPPLLEMFDAKSPAVVRTSTNHTGGPKNMMSPVLLVALAYYEILRSIVILNAVQVMDNFIRLQISTKCLLRYKAMLVNPSIGLLRIWVPFSRNCNVPVRSFVSSGFVGRTFSWVVNIKDAQAFSASFWRISIRPAFNNPASAISASCEIRSRTNALTCYLIVFHALLRKVRHAV